MSERLDDTYEIIHQQQLIFAEVLDNKDRKFNIIVIEVFESAGELGSIDGNDWQGDGGNGMQRSSGTSRMDVTCRGKNFKNANQEHT